MIISCDAGKYPTSKVPPISCIAGQSGSPALAEPPGHPSPIPTAGIVACLLKLQLTILQVTAVWSVQHCGCWFKNGC